MRAPKSKFNESQMEIDFQVEKTLTEGLRSCLIRANSKNAQKEAESLRRQLKNRGIRQAEAAI